MISVIFICMVFCHLFLLVGDRLHANATGHRWCFYRFPGIPFDFLWFLYVLYDFLCFFVDPTKSLRSCWVVFCLHVGLCIRILAWSNADRWVVNSCNIWSVCFSFVWYSFTTFFLVGDRLHLDVTGHQVLWLPGRPGGPGGPSESSEGSRELHG